MMQFAIRIDGADRLDRALSDGPQDVARAAEQAGPEVRRVLGNAIANETNIDTGFLVTHEHLFQAGPWAVMFEDIAEYASFVEDRFMFIEKGQEDAESAVVGVYADELDQYAVRFGE